MSGSGLGYLDVLHFVSCIPNPAPFHEYKGESNVPFHCATSTLKCQDGMIVAPSGPGFGIELDAEFVRKAEKVKT
jgi:L-alanine-DL-glutamate epimerase-like enolase superfamily enzyme